MLPLLLAFLICQQYVAYTFKLAGQECSADLTSPTDGIIFIFIINFLLVEKKI